MSHTILQWFRFYHQIQLFQCLNSLFPTLKTVKTLEVFTCLLSHGAVIINNFDPLKPMGLSQSKIIGVVGRGHLKSTGTKGGIHIAIFDNGDDTVGKGKPYSVFRQLFITVIIGIDSHSRIPEHGLGPGRGHHKPFFTVYAVFKGISNVIKKAVLLFMLHFKICEGGTAAGAPVYNVLSLVNESILVKPDKNFSHGIGQALIHGESFPVPVTGCPQPFELMDNSTAGLFTPFPHRFNKFFPSQLIPCYPLLRKISLHNILGCNAGMICTWHP